MLSSNLLFIDNRYFYHLTLIYLKFQNLSINLSKNLGLSFIIALTKLFQGEKHEKLLSLVLLAGSGMLFTGCVSVSSPATGAFYTGTKSALMTTGETLDESKKKVREATCKAILGVAVGDCSIETAAKNGGIKKIHHVDSESFNVLWIYGEYKVIVTGE